MHTDNLQSMVRNIRLLLILLMIFIYNGIYCNVGIMASASYGIKFLVNGSATPSAEIRSTGNMLIGTPTDDNVNKIQVNGNIASTGSLNFGFTGRQMINLYSTTYGLGIQASTLYFRTGSGYAWYRGGVHDDAQNNPGGGTIAMTLNSGSHLTITGNCYAPIFYGNSGDSSAPTFSWTGDSDTGMYRVGSNSLGFSCGGNTMFYFSSNNIYAQKRLYLLPNSNTEATSETTLINSSPLYFRGKYWNGSASIVLDWNIIALPLTTDPTSVLLFRLGTSIGMRLTSNNRLLINTATDDATNHLQVNGGIAGTQLTINKNWDVNKGNIHLTGTTPTISFYDSVSTTYKWILQTSSDKLQVFRNSATGENASNNWQNRFTINNDASITVPILAGTGNRAVYSTANGTLTNTASDKRLKTNIDGITYGLQDVMVLNPVSFNWIDTEKMGSQKEIRTYRTGCGKSDS